MTQTQTQTTARTAPVFAIRSFISWIVETDRNFRAAQNQIDRLSDRF
ncbi:MAG: hypothetical protein WAO69_09030 [Aestuariivita sp.]